MTTWTEFYDNVVEESDNLGSPFFRGLKNNTYKLLPSFFRYFQNLPVSSKDLEQFEKSLYIFYKNKSAVFHINHSQRDSWEILYEMRHHGIPTRLLDWTGSFSVALYFALRNFKKGDTPCIWMLSPDKMNQKSFNSDLILHVSHPGMDYETLFINSGNESLIFKDPIAIFPVVNHPRLVAQSSFFTVHGTNLLPLDEIFAEDIVRKIDIPTSIIPDAKKFLKLINTNEYSLFPDLNGLCQNIMAPEGFFERNAQYIRDNFK